jgi:hypothetical protein
VFVERDVEGGADIGHRKFEDGAVKVWLLCVVHHIEVEETMAKLSGPLFLFFFRSLKWEVGDPAPFRICIRSLAGHDRSGVRAYLNERSLLYNFIFARKLATKTYTPPVRYADITYVIDRIRSSLDRIGLI